MSDPLDQSDSTHDAFLGGRLTIEQTRQGSRAGIDAVFLAAACPAKAGDHILDLGAGSGIVALAIARRIAGARVTGAEIDADLCRLAERNAARNGLQERADFVCGDVTGPRRQLVEAGLAPDSFDHAVANPPFLSVGEARLPPDAKLRRAHALAPGELEKWIKCMATFLKPGGSLTVVHRADALAGLLQYCAGRFGDLTIFPLFPREGMPASRILLQGTKGSRAPLKLAHGMVLHETGNTFTEAAKAVLRDGAGLDVAGLK